MKKIIQSNLSNFHKRMTKITYIFLVGSVLNIPNNMHIGDPKDGSQESMCVSFVKNLKLFGALAYFRAIYS